ncbi:MAG: hypothetical protein ACLPUT_08350 [Solirubrobacteraceae bacterium]
MICLIVIASFAIFVVNESKSASSRQTQAITGAPTGTSAHAPGSAGTSSGGESSVHRTIDEASEELTSPFAGLVSGSSSEWVIRGVKLLLALAVYGFGLSYLARVLRVRV